MNTDEPTEEIQPEDVAVHDLVKQLSSIEHPPEDAILNETTIEDGNGGRIRLNEHEGEEIDNN